MEEKKTTRKKIKPTADVAIAQKDIQIAVFAQEIEAQAGEIRALRSELGKTKTASDSERAAHGAKMAECQNKVSSLESEIDRLGNALSQERAVVHAAQERFLSEIESMRKDGADIMARLAAVEAERNALSADKAELAAEKESLSADKAKLVAEKESLSADKAKLVAEKESLSADKAKLVAENVRIAEECRAVREAMDRSLASVEFLQEGNRGLMSRLEAGDAERADLSSANAMLTADNSRLEGELGTARAYGKDQEAKLSAEKALSAQFKQKADARYAEIASVKGKLKKSQDAEASAIRRAESAESKLSAANRLLRECREREDARRLVKRFHRLVKGLLPYGLVCTWKRMAYGICEDRPLFAYPGFFRKCWRIVKFFLPYFVVAPFNRAR